MGKKKPIQGRRIQVALVGCGRVGLYHFKALQKFQANYEISALVDEYPQAAQKLDSNIAHFTTIDDMLEANHHPDLVVLATPSGLHAPQAISAMRAGCHVVSEKPLATRIEDGLMMIREADKAGVHLFVVKQNRYNPPVQALKQAIDDGRFGQMYMTNLNVFWSRPQAYYDQAKWRGTWEFDGGALMNQACHYADMLSWLVGPVESIQAMSATLARRIQAEDTIVLNIRWRNGCLGSLNVTTLTHNADFEGSITMLGEKGTVRIAGIAMNEIKHWAFDEMLPEDKNISKLNYQTDNVYGFGHNLYYERLIATLTGTAAADVTGRDAYRALEIIIAAYRSARDGSMVSLPLVL